MDRNGNSSNTKLSVYLQQLSGQVNFLHPYYLDHPYAKPINWKPDNVFAKPLKTLFVTKKDPPVSLSDSNINVTDGDSAKPQPAYDDTKAKHYMNETEKLLLTVISAESSDPDWESKLNKASWSLTQVKLYDRAMRILNHDRLARLAQQGSWNEPVLRRVMVEKSARRFRALMSSFGWKTPLLHWLHNVFIDYLDISYLVSYIDIMQTLKKKIPSLMERMLSSINYNSRIPHETMMRLFKKPIDPGSLGLSCYNPTRLPGNPLILIVPSAPGTNTLQNARVQRWFNSLSMIGHVSLVSTNNLLNTKATMTMAVDHMLAATRAKLAELRADHSGRAIILVGFNAGAALALQVALLETVTAVISIGFPLKTVEEKRGQPDDAILNLSTPVLFIAGQHASTASVDDLEDLRERIHVESGLLVVGSADDQLRVSKSKLLLEGITQCMVDRCVVDEIADFVGTILMSPPPPATPVSPAGVPTIVRSTEGRAKMKYVEKKRKLSGSDESSPSPRKAQMMIGPKRSVGRPPNPLRTTFRPKWTASNDVPIPRKSSVDGVRTLSQQQQSVETISIIDLINDDSPPTPLTSEDNLMEQLTPDRLMDMPVIIAQDETPEPSPVKMVVSPRKVGRPPGKRNPVKGAKIIVNKDGVQMLTKKTIKTMGLKDDSSRPRIKHFPAVKHVDSSDL